MSQAATTVKLLASEERYVKKATKFLTVKSGLAVQELPTQTAASLEKVVLTQFKASFELFDPMKDEMAELFDDTPQESVIPKLKETILATATKSSQLLWQNYKNIKSEFINHWKPHYTMTSGMNEDDALENDKKWRQPTTIIITRVHRAIVVL